MTNTIEGYLEEKTEKLSKEGKKYFSVRIDGRTASAWHEVAKIIETLPIGTYVVAGLTQTQSNGRTYNNLTSIGAKERPTNISSKGPDAREKSIQRQVAFKGAIEVVVAKINKGENVAVDMVVSSLTDMFEEILEERSGVKEEDVI